MGGTWPEDTLAYRQRYRQRALVGAALAMAGFRRFRPIPCVEARLDPRRQIKRRTAGSDQNFDYPSPRAESAGARESSLNS